MFGESSKKLKHNNFLALPMRLDPHSYPKYVMGSSIGCHRSPATESPATAVSGVVAHHKSRKCSHNKDRIRNSKTKRARVGMPLKSSHAD